uniref:Glycosyl hydrolase n=1 Tax=Mesocestoides corti TaxID=53468 RepID=A0A5K3FWW1_MESCO
MHDSLRSPLLQRKVQRCGPIDGTADVAFSNNHLSVVSDLRRIGLNLSVFDVTNYAPSEVVGS